jgi:orotidine-5'-phosphate decarboxylase
LNTHLIAAIDTPNVQEAIDTVRRLKDHVFAFKIGHALVLPNGLGIIDTLRDAGAFRVFLDMKFHDIPNSVALGVYEAARHGVWMMTVHASGGKAMMVAAVEAVRDANPEIPPCLVAVTVLTSVDQEALSDQLGVERTVHAQVKHLARLAMQSELDGVVCSGTDVEMLRAELGHEPILVTPGIRPSGAGAQDQKRVSTGGESLRLGANYLVVGRALTGAEDPEKALAALDL